MAACYEYMYLLIWHQTQINLTGFALILIEKQTGILNAD